jgi:hypothetical protein
MQGIIVTCKGRRKFVEKTLPEILPHFRGVYLVDYDCPDHTGAYVEKIADRKPFRTKSCLLKVVYVRDRPIFNKPEALNSGAQAAISDGLQDLIFLDADTIVKKGFFEYIADNLTNANFLIAGLRPDGSDMPDVTGILAVKADNFRRSGGFDTGFRGWGAEDLEMRLKLYLRQNLDFCDIPLKYVSAITHSNDLRSRYYTIKDIYKSNSCNMDNMYENIESWGADQIRVALTSRLFYHHGPTRDCT